MFTAELKLNSNGELAVISFNNSTGNIVFNKTIEGELYIPDGASLSGNVFSGNAAAASAFTSAVTIALSGDATGSNTFISAGTTSTIPVALNTVNSNVGVFGNSSAVASIDVTSKGLIVGAESVPINVTSSQVSDFNTAVSAYISTDSFLTENNGVISLNNTSVVSGTYGSADSTLVLAVNQKGQITNISANTISIPASQVSDFNSAVNSSVNSYLVAGTGISISSGNISADPAGINHNNLLNYVASQHIDHNNVEILAGNGLVGGGNISATRTINVGAGSGITVNADDISVDSTVVRTNANSTLSSSYVFTGTVNLSSAIATASTQANTDNSNRVATTAYVKNRY
jgi:hypothetical protein